MDEKGVGRPSVITQETLSKLRAVLQRGLSIKKACNYARIGEKTFYRHMNNDIEFKRFVEDCKAYATIIAGEVVVDDIVTNRSVSTAKWWLERKDPEGFSLKPQRLELVRQEPYEFISDAEFVERAEKAGVYKLNPADIAKALERHGLDNCINTE